MCVKVPIGGRHGQELRHPGRTAGGRAEGSARTRQTNPRQPRGIRTHAGRQCASKFRSEGGTDKSYGIQVARLAGVPKEVLERAKQILGNLEESELTPEGNVRQSSRRQQDRDKLKSLAPPPQMDLFSQPQGEN